MPPAKQWIVFGIALSVTAVALLLFLPRRDTSLPSRALLGHWRAVYTHNYDWAIKEIRVLSAMRTIGDAQNLYLKEDYDSDGKKDYAAHLGRLYETKQGAGDLTMISLDLAKASDGFGFEQPFEGYYFRVLFPEGMGFALLAWPASYRETGRLTFMMDLQGEILERDLGDKTDALCRKQKMYTSNKDWEPITPDLRGVSLDDGPRIEMFFTAETFTAVSQDGSLYTRRYAVVTENPQEGSATLSIFDAAGSKQEQVILFRLEPGAERARIDFQLMAYVDSNTRL